MSDSGETSRRRPHIAILPSAGMGHLTPFLRLAASLATHNCQLTLITTRPTVSLAETHLISRFLSAFPQVTTKEFNLLPLHPQNDNNNYNNNDPFFLQFEAISRSAHLLSPLISAASPPLSAFITDISLASAVIPITSYLHLPNFVLFTSSAHMLSLCAYFPFITATTITDDKDYINMPGLPPMPKSWLPPPLLDRGSLFAEQFTANGRKLNESNGIIINTFEGIEVNTVTALNEGNVVEGLPPVIPIGPLVPCEFERGPRVLIMSWLDEQRDGSVVYVSFGSRTAMSREQIRELGEGLLKSGHKFLWVVKGKKVDRDDEEGVAEVVGGGNVMKAEEEQQGMVVKEWVDQSEVLGHRAVGGFVSHCGWNSVMEAAWNGVRVLGWPQIGDQRVNAGLVERCGLGVWERRWGWGGEKEVVVGGEEIGRKIREMMEDEGLKVRAKLVREEARRAVNGGGDGSSVRALKMLVETWRSSSNATTLA